MEGKGVCLCVCVPLHNKVFCDGVLIKPCGQKGLIDSRLLRFNTARGSDNRSH